MSPSAEFAGRYTEVHQTILIAAVTALELFCGIDMTVIFTSVPPVEAFQFLFFQVESRRPPPHLDQLLILFVFGGGVEGNGKTASTDV